MAKLERRDTMSSVHLSVVLVGVGVGVQMVTLAGDIVDAAGQSAWISLLLGGILYGSAAYGMVILGQAYPEDSFVEYIPKLLGPWIGLAVAWYLLLLLVLEYCVLLRNFTNIIAFSMFDRTPLDVISMVMLALSCYGAMQRWGSILRITQYFTISAIPAIVIIWSANILNFNIENLMPFWPEDLLAVGRGALQSWSFYSGYEIILVILPFVRPASPGLLRAVGIAFATMAVLYILGMVMVISVLSVGSIKQVAYPMFAAVRGIAIPGTFVERLENYLLIAWIPTVFDTVMIVLYNAAQIMMKLVPLTDHRPTVLAIAPFLFMGVALLDRREELEAANKILTWLGVGFSLAIIPSCLFLLWLRRKHG